VPNPGTKGFSLLSGVKEKVGRLFIKVLQTINKNTIFVYKLGKGFNPITLMVASILFFAFFGKKKILQTSRKDAD
jgi:hypothetical protein